MAILKHIASKSSNYGAALEYLIFKHDELRKTPILDQNGNRIMRDEFYLDGLNCEPYSFDAACQQLNREYQKNKNKNEIKSHHYIISFDPRDSTENCLTGKRAQELGLEYAKANFPGHQALVCTHMDGHNGSGNIHVHIVINSLRKLDVPKQPFMERPIDCKAGYKHHVTNEYLKHLQKSLMDLCRREFLHQVDLLSPSRTGVTEAEYWAQRQLDEKKQEIEREELAPNPTRFQTQKQLIRDAVAAAREKAISYEDFQDILQDEYDVFVKSIRQAQQEPYRVRRIERQIRQLTAEKAHTQGIKEKLYGDYADEILTREDFLNYNELYSKRIEEYNRKITELEAERQNLQTAPNAYPFLDVYRKYRKLEEITRPMVVELIEKIEVYEGNRVEITFRFQDEIADLLEELHQKQMGQREVSA